VDPLVRALFVLVTVAERIGQAEMRTSLADEMDWCTYHALLVSFLAYRAKHVLSSEAVVSSTEGGGDFQLLARNLANIVAQHTPNTEPLRYVVRARCCSLLAPAMLVRFKSTLYVGCRGASSVQKAVKDLKIGLTAVDIDGQLPHPARVHTGFLDPYNNKTLHIQGFLSHNPGSTWDSDENRYAAGRLPGIVESWDQTNAEIPCDPQRWLK